MRIVAVIILALSFSFNAYARYSPACDDGDRTQPHASHPSAHIDKHGPSPKHGPKPTPKPAYSVATLLGPEIIKEQDGKQIRTFGAPADVKAARIEVINGAGVEGYWSSCSQEDEFDDLLSCLKQNIFALLCQRRRIAQVEILLNGKVLVSKKLGLFDHSINVPVKLLTANKLEVKVIGSKNSYVTIRVRALIPAVQNNAPVPQMALSATNGIRPLRIYMDASCAVRARSSQNCGEFKSTKCADFGLSS